LRESSDRRGETRALSSAPRRAPATAPAMTDLALVLDISDLRGLSNRCENPGER